MEIIFEKGSEEKPKGHALLYFRSSSDPEELWASYLVVLPIAVDLSKYVPPFLMNQVGELGPKELSAFAFPPAPEKAERIQEPGSVGRSEGRRYPLRWIPASPRAISHPQAGEARKRVKDTDT